MNRRGFLLGLGAALAAGSLMPVRALAVPHTVIFRTKLPPARWRHFTTTFPLGRYNPPNWRLAVRIADVPPPAFAGDKYLNIMEMLTQANELLDAPF